MILIVYLNVRVRLQQYIIYLNLQSSGGFLLVFVRFIPGII